MFAWAVTAVQRSVISFSNYFVQGTSLTLQKDVTFPFITFIHVALRVVDMFSK